MRNGLCMLEKVRKSREFRLVARAEVGVFIFAVNWVFSVLITVEGELIEIIDVDTEVIIAGFQMDEYRREWRKFSVVFIIFEGFWIMIALILRSLIDQLTVLSRLW